MESLRRKYWTAEDYEKLSAAKTYRDLFLVAQDILTRMHQPVGQVCGPITTGGTGSTKDNLQRLESMIVGLQEHGLELFDQIPFQLKMHEIKKNNGEEDEMGILTGFYLPIFEARLVQTLYFLPGWESSYGSQWEHEQGKRLGMHIVYLQ